MLLPMEFGVKICKFLSGKMELQFRTNLGAYFTALALEYKQGGKCTLESRASTEVYYPIHVTKVLAIQATGTALSIMQTNYGFGLVASNANSAGFTLLNCSEEAPRYYKEASWIVIGI